MRTKLHKYRCLSPMLPSDSQRRLVLITGARQTGKTTLAKKLYKDLGYYNLDSLEIRSMMRNMTAAGWGRAAGNSVIDEAQKEPSVFEKIKFAYDRGDISFSVILGSSQILLLKRIRESLAGRVFVYELWPLMLSEILTEENDVFESPLIDAILQSSSITNVLELEEEVLLSEENDRRMEAMSYLLTWGGMPELLSLEDRERTQWLKSYIFTYLERDLSDLARISDLEPFNKFERLSALRSGNILVYSSLAKDTGISVSSARRYMEYLRLSYQAILLQPYSENITSSVIKSPKIYWLDIGILRALTGFWGDAEGSLFETFAVSELYKWLKTHQSDVRLFYYRTRSGMEIDLILSTPRGIIGIEIKNRKNIEIRDCKGMTRIAENVTSGKWLGGIVIYAGQRIFRLYENIWAVPAHRLF